MRDRVRVRVRVRVTVTVTVRALAGLVPHTEIAPGSGSG